MELRLALVTAALCACNAKLADGPVDAPGGDGRPDTRIVDASDAGPTWTAPAPVPGASLTTVSQDDCTLNSTQTELYFKVPDPANVGSAPDLWLMTRAAATDPWGVPGKLDATFNTGVTQESPRLSPDDKTIYFGRNGDIYTATRSAVGQPWSTPIALTSVNTANYEKWLAVCTNGYFLLSRNGNGAGQDLYEGKLGGAAATIVPELNSPQNETSTFLSTDCLTTYFASNRDGTTTQIYTATRASVTATWTTPVLVTAFGASNDNEDPWMSVDQHTFVFATVRPPDAYKAVYQSTR